MEYALCKIDEIKDHVNHYRLEPIELTPGKKAYGFLITDSTYGTGVVGKQLVVINQEEIEAVRNFLTTIRS